MATKKKPPLYSQEDEEIGNDFLEILRGCHGETMSEKFRLHHDSVARKLLYINYNDLPNGAKSYISSLGGKKSARQKNKKIEPQKKKTSKEKWEEELLLSEDMQHGLHPEDEADIIDSLGFGFSKSE